MRNIQFIFCFLLAIFLCGFGCSSSKPTPDPLAGWQKDYSPPGPSDAIIERDIQDYIQNLPSNQKGYGGSQIWYKDGKGQHAVSVEIFEGNKNASWQHLFFYDKENKRIKVIRYGHIKYQS